MNRHRQFLERGTIFMLWVIAKRLSSDRGGIPDNITFTRAFIADLPLDLESFRLLAVKESGVHISYEAAQSLLTIQEWVDAIVTVVLNSPRAAPSTLHLNWPERDKSRTASPFPDPTNRLICLN